MRLAERLTGPLGTWFRRWSAILPILLAEFIVWLGFGALLPVAPLYFRERGVDFATLGLVIAAWPAARLVGEPIFGWLADRVPRLPLMVAGNVGAGIFQFLPLVIIGPGAFLVLRALQGLSTSMYDPAARGFITDATPPDRRGEAFGLYSAAQMGGLMLGPAIGGLGAAAFGGIGFVFAFGAVSSFVAAITIAVRVREPATAERIRRQASFDGSDFSARPRATREPGDGTPPNPGRTPTRLANRFLAAAIIVNMGANFAAGTYDVIWSVYLAGLGASVELIGMTFATFGLPILLLSTTFGRRIDRGRAIWYVVAGGIAPAVAGVLYIPMRDPLLAVPLILIEATGFAMLNPALYAIVAAGSPAGRSSTAQGIYGASGTIGFVVAALLAGVLAEMDIRLPIIAFIVVMLATLAVGIAVGGRALWQYRSRDSVSG